MATEQEAREQGIDVPAIATERRRAWNLREMKWEMNED